MNTAALDATVHGLITHAYSWCDTKMNRGSFATSQMIVTDIIVTQRQTS